MLHALANGWQPDEISHTGTNVSERDLDVLLAHPIRINLDAVSQIERLGRRAPGRTIGIRINPGAGAGYTEHLAYAGDRPTKFGITADRLDDAIEAVAPPSARRRHAPLPRGLGLAGRPARRVRGGAGRGDRVPRPAARCGLPDPRGERRRRPRPWWPATTSGRSTSMRTPRSSRATSAPYGVTAAFEPGDFVMKDAAVLLGEVVTVERRGGTTFVGLDIGWNVNCSYFIYKYAQEIVPVAVAAPPADRSG